jgi:Fe2+ or Zn2+ uptake regulation protein
MEESPMPQPAKKAAPASYFTNLYGDTVRNRVLSVFLVFNDNEYRVSELHNILKEEGQEVSKQGVYRALDELEQQGLVVQHKKDGNAKLYTYQNNDLAKTLRKAYLKALKIKTRSQADLMIDRKKA